MAKQGETGISWAEETWNPIRGCSRVSEGCRNCYAETVAHRFSGPGQPYEGLVKMSNGHPQWTGAVRVIEKHLLDPIKWERPRRIFVNSMSDLFHETVSDATLNQIFAVMALTPRHKFQVLTKRASGMRDYMSAKETPDKVMRWVETAGGFPKKLKVYCREAIEDFTWPLPNVWLGVSVENQETADERIPLLLQTPAAVRWISAEPLLGPINLHEVELPSDYRISINVPGMISALEKDHEDRYYTAPSSLDWVVVGGESGRNSRPMDVEWARGLKRQCIESGTAFHFKQMGGRITHNDEPIPADLQIREYPA